MRTIHKGPEPASLAGCRAAGGTYEDYGDKQTLRDSLVAEQRSLCCYCQSRIRARPGEMKVEHWHSQAEYPSEQLDYSNLLGVCMGNEGRAKRDQHCDTSKGSKTLSRNPADCSHNVEQLLRFGMDGAIRSSDPIFDAEINNDLNLNLEFLKNNRKATLDAFTRALAKRGEVSRSQLEKWLSEWDGSRAGVALEPYSQVIVSWLRKRLARA